MNNLFGSLEKMESILEEGRQHDWDFWGRSINHRIMPEERNRPTIRGQVGREREQWVHGWGEGEAGLGKSAMLNVFVHFYFAN